VLGPGEVEAGVSVPLGLAIVEGVAVGVHP
jgi:hypothetical protein